MSLYILNKILKTKAAILVEQKKPLMVDEILLPEKLHFGQVLVKVHYTTICGAQINEIEGAKGPDKYLPHLLGHEASGSVEATGEGVKNVKVGDKVVLHWRKGAGIESEPSIYDWKGKKVNAGWVTTFQNYTVVSENRVTPIPSNFDLKIAPLLGCAVTTAFGVVNNDAKIKVGESVVVFGAGGVGINIIQAASMVSAYPIIAIDIVDSKLTMAKKFGATYVFNSKRIKNLEFRIKNLTGDPPAGGGANVIIDTTGNPRVIEKAYELTHPDGKTILVGVPPKSDKVSIYTLPLHFKKILKGSHGGDSNPTVDIPRIIKLLEAKKMSLKGMITHELGLSEINEAINLVKSGRAGRVVIKMS
ncbi:dehydrogenase [Candidatus Gottesmanbacteria bacterium RIFCSPHIGHO2_01_FULL_39_10]|uniref:Dehydrogenase n=1 Tax=Candidatus Gottesmanbacteria bacterium RIFCSPHIGHO2_01_FULL_39_10 TaxID=1798375 RepID=A0A1F5ZP98_9BACT|nr:MAG: dehydrogenase [Candidatus Gottesmanbacteria bacterium RIFCSPHIGHO2_01_FULL_39_10]